VTSLLFALRLGLWGIVGWTALAFVLIFLRVESYYAVAGHTAEGRAAFAASLRAVTPQFTLLLPDLMRPETLAGYVEYGGFLPLSILFAVWAMTSATGSARGDEERGVVEAALSTGLARPALVIARMASFAIAITAATTAAAIAYVLAASTGGDAVDIRSLIEEALLFIAFGLSCYALSFLVAQVVAARFATAAAGIVLLGLFLVNSLSRTYPSLSGWRWLSPFRYLDLSRPFPPGGTFDVNALVAMLGMTLVAGSAAAAAFAQRDLWSPLVRIPMPRRAASYDASRNPLWGIPVVRGLWERRVGLLAWSAGLAGLAAIYVSLTKTIVEPLLSIRALAPYFESFVHGNVYPAFLGFTWLNVTELLVAAVAITHVARWAAEDTDGRLELILSQPHSRLAVVAERMVVLAVSVLVIAAVSGEVVFYAAHRQDIHLNGSRLAAATLMLVPFALVFASAGSLLAAWKPRAAVGLVGAIAFASYMDVEVGALLKLPLWVQDLSAFKLIGRPLVDGVDGRNLAIMLLLAAVGIGSSILALQRRDLGS
jgi:ABC-2 type transport system permease protein